MSGKKPFNYRNSSSVLPGDPGAACKHRKRQVKQQSAIALHLDAQLGEVRYNCAADNAKCQRGADPGRSRDEEEHSSQQFGNA